MLHLLPDSCIASLCAHLDAQTLSSLAACCSCLNASVLSLLDALRLDADGLAPPTAALPAKLRHVRSIDVRRGRGAALAVRQLQQLLELAGRLPSAALLSRLHFPRDQLLLPGPEATQLLLRLIAGAPALASVVMPYVSPSEATPPELLAALPAASLRRLDLGGAPVRGADLAALSHLTALEELHVGAARELAGRQLHALGGLTRLRALTLGPLQQLGAALHSLGRLAALEQLDLGADVGAASFGALARFSALRSLVLNDCPGLCEVDLEALAGLRQLSSLRAGITVTAASWRLLAGLPQLQHLDIRALVLHPQPAQQLPPSASVASADLLVLNAGAGVSLARLLPSLRVLQLDVATAGSLGSLAGHPQLSKLYVARCNEHALTGLAQLSSLRALGSLSLMAASRAGVSGIATVGRSAGRDGRAAAGAAAAAGGASACGWCSLGAPCCC
jgi:hypothetical protein